MHVQTIQKLEQPDSLLVLVNSYCFRSPLGARPVVIEDKRTKLFLD